MAESPLQNASGPDLVELAPGVRVHESVVNFSYTASGGPGGQNVNKRSTKARLRIALDDIPISYGAVGRLRVICGSQLSGDGEIIIASDEHRTQARNRGECLDRLREMIVRAQVRPKPRKKTKPSRGAIERRIREKKQRGETKRRRKDLDG